MTESIIVLASGSKTGGGSGFEKLVEYFNNGNPNARVVGVVSNVLGGGVEQRAERLNIPFMHLPNSECTIDGYGAIVPFFDVLEPWYAASGWLRKILGLPYGRAFNIHPALLSQLNGRFGGPGLYGHHVHEAVHDALMNNLLGPEPESGFTMHFVSPEYDRGPAFCEVRTRVTADMDPDAIGAAVNKLEHQHQSRITELVVTGMIRLEHGRVIVPADYDLLPRQHFAL